MFMRKTLAVISAINHPTEFGMGIYVDSLMELFR